MDDRRVGAATVDTLVVAAMPRELRPLARSLALRGEQVAGCRAWVGRAMVVAAVGVGPTRAAGNVSRLLDTLGAQRVIVVGVAGARSAGAGAAGGGHEPERTLRVGDLIAPSLVVDATTGERFDPGCFLPLTHRGALVSVPRFEDAGAGPHFTAGEEVRSARRGPTAVDMETAAVARVCVMRGVPWDAVRAVSDVPGTVTKEVADILSADGRPDLGRLLRLVGRDPSQLLRLVRLARGFRLAVTSLTRALTGALVDGGDVDGNRRVVPPPSQ